MRVSHLLIIASLFVNPPTSFAKEDYLYEGHDESDPVLDYVVQQSKKAKYPYPSFLNSTDNGPRIVEFYAPWCPHCQHFKPHYVQQARDVRATPEGANVMFYAVSCTVHKTICKDEGVHGYPTVKYYRAGNATGEVRNREAKTDDVLANLGIQRLVRQQNKTGVPVKKRRGPTPAEIAAQSHVRTQSEIFADAALSFDYALRHSIYTSHGPLGLEARDALRDWLGLLHRALPAAMESTHGQIDALQSKFHSVVKSEEDLHSAVDGIKPKESGWSLSCTRGDHHTGYTCGLWEIFHIMTVGVAEWNSMQGWNSRDRIPTLDAANALRGYVAHFFGCDECRKNFLEMYDDCKLERCSRLNALKGGSPESWKELALWLWEAHNAVNVRLQKERAEREGVTKPTAVDDQKVRWPNREACTRCWNTDGSFDKDGVYNFLRSEYWPKAERAPAIKAEKSVQEKRPASNKEEKREGEEGGRAKFLRKRIKRIERIAMTHEAEFIDASMAFVSSSVVMPCAAVVAVAACWLLGRQKEKVRIGRGKKFDEDSKQGPAGLPRHRPPTRKKHKKAGVL